MRSQPLLCLRSRWKISICISLLFLVLDLALHVDLGGISFYAHLLNGSLDSGIWISVLASISALSIDVFIDFAKNSFTNESLGRTQSLSMKFWSEKVASVGLDPTIVGEHHPYCKAIPWFHSTAITYVSIVEVNSWAAERILLKKGLSIYLFITWRHEHSCPSEAPKHWWK